MKTLVAGSTGYLGSHIIKELQNRAMDFVAIARDQKKLLRQGLREDQIKLAEVTNPNELAGVCEGIDTVISTVGITRQKDGLSYMDVDYQANKNLLDEAIRAGVKQFIYISVINGEQFRHLKIMEAKERFVDELKASPIDHTVIRPNGFFSDMKDFLDMALKGRIFLFGDGNYKLNPIHGKDLATICVFAIGSKKKEISVGGPEVLSQNEIVASAFNAVGKPIKVTHLSDWLRKSTLFLLRKLTSVSTYGPIEFFLTLMAQDQVAPRAGVHRLENFFTKEADKIS